MSASLKKPSIPWPIMLASFLLVAVMILIGILYNRNSKTQLFRQTSDELTVIRDLKASQIESWRKSKLDYASTVQNNLALFHQVELFLSGKEIGIGKEELLLWFKAVVENNDFRNAQLIDSEGNVILAFPESDSTYGTYRGADIIGQLANKNVFLSDFHLSEGNDFVHLDLLIPLWGNDFRGKKAKALIMFRVDPAKTLYPLIESWPLPSKSSETLLLRRDGDSIVYLNNVRHVKNTALKLKIPVTMNDFMGTKASIGFEEAMHGVDYRNVQVIAATRRIKDTEWFIVAKTDRKEVAEKYKDQIFLNQLISILFISVVLSIIGSIIWFRRVKFYREKYESEVEKQALKRHYDYILKYANDIILLMDENMTIIEANDRAVEAYKYPYDELIGINIKKLRLPELLNQQEEQIKILNEVKNTMFETVHICKDNTTFPIEISARLVEIEGEKYYQSIGRDITERKKAELLLFDTEQTYSGLVNTITEAIYIHKDDGVFMDVNEGAVNMYGYSREELIGKTPLFVSAPGKNNMEDISSIIKRVFRTGQKEQFEFWGKRKNGEVFLKDVVSNKGKYFGEEVVISTARDITDRKMVEEALTESRERILSIFRVAPTGIGVVKERVLCDVNPRICEMTGYEPSELNGRNSLILYPTQEEFDYVGKVKYEQIEKIGTGIVETRWKRKDGSIIDVLLASTPLHQGDLSYGVTFTALDITDRKRAERELIIAKEKAEESDRLKTAFLHNISHEIRTPMNAIVGFTALLDDPDLRDEDRKQFIETIYQSSNQLLSIITDIVDISNIESGQIRVTFGQANINSIIRNLFEQYSIRMKEGIKFSYKLSLDDDKATLETDSTKLIQILSNLLNNSLKFTKEGRIECGYTLRGDYIEFFVSDTGIGIPADKLSNIFERFYQVENTASRKYGGTGLGLSISSAYAELLGGNLRVESEPGEGSTFYFTVPFQKNIEG